VDGGDIQLTAGGNLLAFSTNLEATLVSKGEDIKGTILTQTNNQLVANFTNVPAG
jgi:hypothetical protein